MLPKKELVRIVRSPEGSYTLDLTGKASGRGAYVCRKGACCEKCVSKKLLNKSFKMALPEEIYVTLKRLSEEKD
jgi:predicted RNA-binding protein YlxR (DUF448 family)